MQNNVHPTPAWLADTFGAEIAVTVTLADGRRLRRIETVQTDGCTDSLAAAARKVALASFRDSQVKSVVWAYTSNN